MNSGFSCVRFLHCLLLVTFIALGAGCAAPPAPRPPGRPDPGVLHHDNKQEIKVGVGKPGYKGDDATEKYESRDDGLLDNKALGVKGIWRF